jgi:hypothetical protein
LYPDVIDDIIITESPIWHVSDAAVGLDITDTSGSQEIAVSSDGETFVSESNTASLSVDFDAEGVFGTTAVVNLSLGRYDGGDATKSPTTGDAPQEVTGLTLDLTTDDLPLIDGTVTLGADSWLANMQQLHEIADARFTVDHRADGLVVESYRQNDPKVAKEVDWTTDGLDAYQLERDTTEYWNKGTVYAPDADFDSVTIRNSAEIDRVGTVKPNATTTSETNRDLVVQEARQFVRRGIGGDRLSGSVQIVPTYVAPGYPYKLDEFDGRANLETVQISVDGASESGSLSFGARRNLVAAIQQRTR